MHANPKQNLHKMISHTLYKKKRYVYESMFNNQIDLICIFSGRYFKEKYILSFTSRDDIFFHYPLLGINHHYGDVSKSL